MRRTIRLFLEPTTKQAEILLRTLPEYTDCFNAVCAVGWQKRCKNAVKLHHETYWRLRTEHPDMPSGLVISARVRATEAIKSALNRLNKDRKVSGRMGVSYPSGTTPGPRPIEASSAFYLFSCL